MVSERIAGTHGTERRVSNRVSQNHHDCERWSRGSRHKRPTNIHMRDGPARQVQNGPYHVPTPTFSLLGGRRFIHSESVSFGFHQTSASPERSIALNEFISQFI